ncbi:MAG TPA: hypothetical protein VLH39_05365, partial [Magnetospirillaceae bacterium]|nr:hypothetical protein [Magnetospirillaceae bacterium]
RSRVRGYLQARGMGGSVAGASVLAEPATQQMRTVAGAAENLYTDNETSKVQSRDQYLRAIYENDVQRRAERVGDFQGLVGGMGDAAITGLQVREQEKAAGAERARQWDKDRAETSDKRRQRLIELANVLSDSDDPEDRERARKILYEIAIMKD